MRLMIMIIDILSYIVAYAIFLEKSLLSDFVWDLKQFEVFD